MTGGSAGGGLRTHDGSVPCYYSPQGSWAFLDQRASSSSSSSSSSVEAGPAESMYRVQKPSPVGRPQLFIHTDQPKSSFCSFYGVHPHRWTKDDVRQWLEWCIEEFALEGVQVEKFACMNGKALCMLTRQNFTERAKNVGDVLFNTLQWRLDAATSPGAVVIPPDAFYTRLVSQHDSQYESQQVSIASPASAPSCCSVQSPIAAASPPVLPPAALSRQHNNIQDRPVASPSYTKRISRTPSPCSDSPLNLSREATATAAAAESLTADVICRHAVPRDRCPPARHLSVPASYGAGTQRTSPSPPHLSPHSRSTPWLSRQVSEGAGSSYAPPGSRSPVRRPSPSADVSSPLPLKLPRLICSHPAGTSAPSLFSPTYSTPRELSPDTHDIRKQLAFTRLSSVDESASSHRRHADISFPSPPVAAPVRQSSQVISPVAATSLPSVAILAHQNVLDARKVEPISDAEPEEGTGSDVSLPSEGDAAGKQNRNDSGSESESPSERHVTDAGNCVYYESRAGQESRRIAYPYGDMQIPLPVKTAENAEDCYNPDKPDGEGGQGDTKLLWEFIYQLLRSPDYTSLLRWEDESRLVFRITNPSKLAHLWGLQKSRGNMTYEKLSRALRYYYKMNIIVKEPHRRLTYRFVKPPEHIQRGQKGAKPGVAHRRRGSFSGQEVPQICVSTPPSAAPTSDDIFSAATSTTASNMEINGNVVKQEPGVADMAVFPTNRVCEPMLGVPPTATAYYPPSSEGAASAAAAAGVKVDLTTVAGLRHPSPSPSVGERHSPATPSSSSSTTSTTTTSQDVVMDKQQLPSNSPTDTATLSSPPLLNGHTQEGEGVEDRGVVETVRGGEEEDSSTYSSSPSGNNHNNNVKKAADGSENRWVIVRTP